MDTRYWGSSGWRLLHLISFAAPSLDQKDVQEFYNTLPYVLPCKYCRKSLTEYMQSDPVATEGFGKWLWRIHNDVNDKLRSQHLWATENPPFKLVKQVYEERLAAPCTRTTFEGWEFLFSVAEAHPMSNAGRHSEPIHGADHSATDPLERNRWNIMAPAERLPYYTRFWELLPKVLPFPEWRKVASTCDNSGWATRQETLKALWGIRCKMETELELLNRTTYTSLCKELRHFRSGCTTARRGKTCRRKK